MGAMLGYVVAVWLVAVVGGYLPLVVAALSVRKSDGTGAGTGAGAVCLSVLNVLSGGVFIAAGFMHLLPEAERGLRDLSREWDFQLAPFFASLGFVILFVLEELVQQASVWRNPFASTAYFYGPLNDTTNWPTEGQPRQQRSNRDSDDRWNPHDTGDSHDCPPSGTHGSLPGIGSGKVRDKPVDHGALSREGNDALDEHLPYTSLAQFIGGSVASRGSAESRGSAGSRKVCAPGFVGGFPWGHPRSEEHKGGETGGTRGSANGAPPVVVSQLSLRQDGNQVGGRSILDLPLSGGGAGEMEADSRGILAAQMKSHYGTVAPPSQVMLGGAVVGSTDSGRLLADETQLSPVREGQGPWIGRRLSPPEVAALAAAQEESGSCSLARSWGTSVVNGCCLAHHSPTHVALMDHGGKQHSELAGGVYSVKMGLVLGAVLSFHSVMEGLGLGASHPSRAVGIFSAIVMHKGLAAFSLGCIFFSSDASRFQYVLCMAIFSILTPLAAIAGMVVRASFDSSAGAGICIALGAGTFLHVAAMEVLPRDLLHDTRMKGAKLACLVGGYLTFAALSRYV